MNSKTEPTNPRWDLLRWLLVWLLIGAGIAANIYYEAQPAALRIAAGVILGLVVIGIASFTTKGKQVWMFAREARVELRKVVWPTRQETFQTTLIIAGIVAITALFLWGVDSLLLWAISLLTGQRG